MSGIAPIPGLSKAAIELLALLLEEMGEAQQAIGKVLRHGYDSSWAGGPTNVVSLQVELGHVVAAVDLLCASTDLDWQAIQSSAEAKLDSVGQFTHHNDIGILVSRLRS